MIEHFPTVRSIISVGHYYTISSVMADVKKNVKLSVHNVMTHAYIGLVHSNTFYREGGFGPESLQARSQA